MKIYEELLVLKDTSLKMAMQLLDQTGKNVLFVVEENRMLVGSLSDGDIRRWILDGGNLKAKVSLMMNSTPIYVTTSVINATARSLIAQNMVKFIPVVDNNHIVIDILSHKDILSQTTNNKEVLPALKCAVVIMAGGKGTRLEPFTNVLPKPLIPVGDKTILEHIIDRYLLNGIDKYYISVNYKAGIIKSYFEDLNPSYEIEYINEDEPLGTAGALHKLDGHVNLPLIITNCDIIIETDYADILSHHEDELNDITIVASVKHYSIPYGVCEINKGGGLKSISEKPEYSLLVNTGMYVINPDVLKKIPKDTFFHFTDLIESVNNAGGTIGIYPIGEHAWIDTGEWDMYKAAVKRYVQ